MYTEFIETASIAAYARLCNLRLGADAQKEIRVYAGLVDACLMEAFPVSWKALQLAREPVPQKPVALEPVPQKPVTLEPVKMPTEPPVNPTEPPNSKNTPTPYMPHIGRGR